jgi:hypothetical protein
VARVILDRFPSPPRGRVDGILIRRVKNIPFYEGSAITRSIVRFDNFIEVALIFSLLGLLSGPELRALLRSLHNRYALPRAAIASVLQRGAALVNQHLPSEMLAEVLADYAHGGKADKAPEESSDLRLPDDRDLAQLSEDEILESCKRWVDFT